MPLAYWYWLFLVLWCLIAAIEFMTHPPPLPPWYVGVLLVLTAILLVILGLGVYGWPAK